MNNNSKLISASEINRYVYCHYQWYYERLYGRKYLRELYKQRNEELGYTDSEKSNFAKGLKFHENYPSMDKSRSVVRLAVLTAVLLVLALVYYYVMIQ